MGPELLGRALRSRVVLMRMRRVMRGHYEIELEPLNEAGEKTANGELTGRYARALERWIRDDPAGWWWSHRRWKLREKGISGVGVVKEHFSRAGPPATPGVNTFTIPHPLTAIPLT
jgi:lauroyl/myristoyl acyltransferase